MSTTDDGTHYDADGYPEDRGETPDPPQNVRLVHPDGIEIPMECRYDGVDGCGQHIWTAVAPQGVALRPGMKLRAAMLPARSSIAVHYQS